MARRPARWTAASVVRGVGHPAGLPNNNNYEKKKNKKKTINTDSTNGISKTTIIITLNHTMNTNTSNR